MKYSLDQIEGMLENFKSPDWDFMLQSQKKLYAASPQIISDLVEEVKWLRHIIDHMQIDQNNQVPTCATCKKEMLDWSHLPKYLTKPLNCHACWVKKTKI